MIKLISKHKNYLHIQFPFRAEIVADVRKVSGRKYVAQDKQWVVPASSLSIEAINQIKLIIDKYDFKVTEEVQALLDNTVTSNVKFKELAANNSLDSIKDYELNIELAEGIKLRGYQQAGIRYLVESKTCILGYAMRLGKSLTAGAAIKHMQAFPLLIITTSSTKIHWKNEFETKLLVDKAHIINGKTSYDLPESNVYIINYAILPDHLENLLKIKFKSVIIDEIHNFGSKGSKRTKAAKQLASNIPIKYGLTGTLFRNNIQELATILDVIGIMPKIANDSWEFLHTYTNAEYNGFGWVFKGGKNLLQLNEKLVSSGSYLRKTQADVLDELPSIQTTVLPVSISNRSEYLLLEKGIKQIVSEVNDKKALFEELLESSILEGKRLGFVKKKHNDENRILINEVLKKITLLKECVGRGKVESAVEWIEEFLRETDEKLVVFAHHKTVQKSILDKFKSARSILSEYSPEQRELERVTFNTDENSRVIVCSLMAASEGIDLSSANTVLHTEYWWNPAIMNQASARIQRVGKLTPLNVYYLSAENSIDQYSESVIDGKAALNEAVDGNEGYSKFFNYFSLSS